MPNRDEFIVTTGPISRSKNSHRAYLEFSETQESLVLSLISGLSVGGKADCIGYFVKERTQNYHGTPFCEDLQRALNVPWKEER